MNLIKPKKKYSLNLPVSKFHTQWYKILIARRIGRETLSKRKFPEKTYADVCLLRYKQNESIYNKQFCKEIIELESMQPSAMAAMRLHRLFAVTTLWPPVHSRAEINWTLKEMENFMKPKERRKLEIIMQDYKLFI